jgi:PI-3-kinase-related kinase SMG-1
MIKYETSKDPNVVNMSDWEILDATVEVSNEFSAHKMIGMVENTLRCAILKKKDNLEQTISLCNDVVHSFLQQTLLTRSKEYLNQLTILNHICQKLATEGFESDSSWKSLYVDKRNGSLTLMG